MVRLPRDVWRRVVGLALYITAGAAVGIYLIAQPTSQSLGLLALLALWIFLGIPACCGLKR